jgi:urease accessory protein
MNALARTGMAAVLLAVPETASAHAVLGVTGFFDGLLHALVVPSHVLAIVALALLIGQQGWGHGWRLGWRFGAVAAYVVAVLAGLGAIALAIVPTLAEQALLVFAMMAGLLAALARPLPPPLGALLAAAVGLSLALDSPPEAITLREANLALVGTALGAAIVLLVLVQGTSRLRRDWQRIGARIVGSWIAASAILVLALRVAA